MRVFVSEYVCGGAWPDDVLDSSLAVEGRAMLVSLVEDLLQVSGCEVVLTWDSRLGPCSFSDTPATVDFSDHLSRPKSSESRPLNVVTVTSRAEEEESFRRLCHESDAVFVIAPEFHGILEDRVRLASRAARVIGCRTDAISLCGDKMRLAEFLADHGVRSIPTQSFDLRTRSDFREFRFPCVVKPRDGAGSQLTYQIASPEQLAGVQAELLERDADFSFIRQPFLDGIAVSCAAIIGAGKGSGDDSPIIVLPAAEQIVSECGSLRYLGADFPGRVTSLMADQVESLVRKCCDVIPGLQGFVGFDLLLPLVGDSTPIVVEINPRLTTGYLLWRQLCSANLASLMLGAGDRESMSEFRKWNQSSCRIRIEDLWNGPSNRIPC